MALALAAFLTAVPAWAGEVGTTGPIAFAAEFRNDTVAVVESQQTGVRNLGYISLSADVSLADAIGWQGARLFAHGIASTGKAPNELAGTLQGINNIEVGENRAKLFELYLEQAIHGSANTLRLGFSDLNAEFYANESASLLLAPAFGIGSELAATGPNGPSIFPSTTLMARLHLENGRQDYAQFAVANAEAGVLGDRGGIRKLFGHGALLIGELGIRRKARVAVGAWTYTHKQDDIRLTDPAGDPLRQQARGAYALIDLPLVESGKGSVSAFARAGISDGDTTPYSGGWQAGLLAQAIMPGRPESKLSLGLHQAFLSNKYRSNAADAGDQLSRTETGVELTYADALAPWLTVQPDIQYVWNPSRALASRNALIFTLRVGLAWP